MFWLRLFLVPYLLTLIVEEAVALLWGYRSGKDLLTVLWINTVTNPLVTLLRYLSAQFLPSQEMRMGILIAAEILVVLAEWLLFRKFLSKGKYFFWFSLCCNAASYGAGLWLGPLLLRLFRGII
ncbi:MAG: hypothetical protein IKG67_03390 [Parasporobacterium sp.]|nr:hypothetical protein [Parasporobacterium sp.]